MCLAICFPIPSAYQTVGSEILLLGPPKRTSIARILKYLNPVKLSNDLWCQIMGSNLLLISSTEWGVERNHAS